MLKSKARKILDQIDEGQTLYDVDEESIRELPHGSDWTPYIFPVYVMEKYGPSDEGDGWEHGYLRVYWNCKKKYEYFIVPHEIARLWKHRPCPMASELETALIPRAMRETVDD